MLLIAGGQLDANMRALAQAAQVMSVPCIDLCVPPASSPLFHWDLDAPPDACPWGGGPLPRGAFIRQDVFAAMADPRPEVSQRALGWFTAVQGWLMAHPQVRTFNADMAAVAFNKPAALLRARAAGLRTPPTWVSNDTAQLRSRLASPCIAKPVAGGGLCQTLSEALVGVTQAGSAMPALIQPCLVAPELRVFVIGESTLAFEVSSPSLDYREHQDAEVMPCEVPPEAAALRRLMQDLRMDFGAADFKTDPHTGALVFLELNTSPMFVHFDQVSQGRLTQAMVHHLMG